jgi:hypothetical protein
MPLKTRLVKIGNKLKPNPEKNHQITADNFLRPPGQNVQQPDYNFQRFADSQPNINHHAGNSQDYGLVSTSTLGTLVSNQVPGLVSTSTVSTGAISQPYGPEDVGRQPDRPLNGVQILELDGSRQFLPDDRHLPAVWEQRESQAYDEYHHQKMEKAKRASLAALKEKKKRDEEQKEREMRHDSSRESVRKARQLIRERYQLDLYVWNKRGVLEANRPYVMESCIKADKILQEVYLIVGSWEQEVFDPKEWEVAKTIKDILSHTERHAIWQTLPPWKRVDDSDSSLL